MPMLTEAHIRAAKPSDKPYKLFDTLGLYLHVRPGGGRHRRLRYHFAGVEKLLALGPYPYITLKRARVKREEARRLLAEGKDPGNQRKAEKIAESHTFELIAREWLELQRKKFAGATFVKAEWTLQRSQRPKYSRCCVGSKSAASMKLHTARSSAVDRYSDMPLRPAVRRVIPQRIYVEPWHLSCRRITRRLLSPPRLPSY